MGAIPGALPPMIGYVAATGDFSIEPGVLFAVQFMWQFPHFWAIAWIADEDYRKVGYKMLPYGAGISDRSAQTILQVEFYSASRQACYHGQCPMATLW